MANKINCSIERQREVVARAQKAIAPENGSERYEQNKAICEYLKQYNLFIHQQARYYSRWRLRYRRAEVVEYMKDWLFDILPRIKLENGSPLSYLHKVLKEARNDALKNLANPVSISHPCYEKAGRINFFFDEYYKEHGIYPSYDEIFNFFGKNGDGKERDYRQKGRRQNSIRLFGKLMANTRPFLNIEKIREPAIEDDGIEELIKNEESGIAKSAFEAILDEREKAVVAFRIGEYEWLPRAYKEEISERAFSKMVKHNKGIFENVPLEYVGEIIGLTGERTRQIEERAYWKIKKVILGGNKNGK